MTRLYIYRSCGVSRLTYFSRWRDLTCTSQVNYSLASFAQFPTAVPPRWNLKSPSLPALTLPSVLAGSAVQTSGPCSRSAQTVPCVQGSAGQAAGWTEKTQAKATEKAPLLYNVVICRFLKSSRDMEIFPASCVRRTCQTALSANPGYVRKGTVLRTSAVPQTQGVHFRKILFWNERVSLPQR